MTREERKEQDIRLNKLCFEYQEKDKRIAELEKENTELKETCNKWFEHLKNREEELLNELNNQNAKYNEQIEQLEKENAELKAVERMALYSKMSDQLAKAKELLERLLITSCNSDVLNLLPNCSEVLRVRVEAEQFLSEVEK